MLNFLVGTLCIVRPKKGVVVVAALGAVKGVTRLVRRRTKQGTVGDAAAALPANASAVGQPVTLEFADVDCVLLDDPKAGPSGGAARPLLRGVSGSAKPGRLLALMGPSGSGKTTLLNVLAGTLPYSPKLLLTGRVALNGAPAPAAPRPNQAFVQQDDVFYSMLTVEETLEMAAQLRLPESMATEARTAYVRHLITVLGLAKAAGTRVGDAKTRGLSGGEKKRLSIGCELVGSPSLLFLDEPTTGLDAFQVRTTRDSPLILLLGGLSHHYWAALWAFGG